jgi:hypothetical protein
MRAGIISEGANTVLTASVQRLVQEGTKNPAIKATLRQYQNDISTAI